MIVDEQEKASVEGLISAVLSALYEQQYCGIESVSTKIEIGALEEIKKRVHELGQK